VSFGHDSIPLFVVNKCIHILANPLSLIFNSSFQTGIFPDQLKIAKLLPIFKEGAFNLFTNYRPISFYLVSQFF